MPLCCPCVMWMGGKGRPHREGISDRPDLGTALSENLLDQLSSLSPAPLSSTAGPAQVGPSARPTRPRGGQKPEKPLPGSFSLSESWPGSCILEARGEAACGCSDARSRWCDGTAKGLAGTMDTLDHALSAQPWQAWQGWAWGELEASPSAHHLSVGRAGSSPQQRSEPASDPVFHFPNPEAPDREPRRPRRGAQWAPPQAASGRGWVYERKGGGLGAKLLSPHRPSQGSLPLGRTAVSQGGGRHGPVSVPRAALSAGLCERVYSCVPGDCVRPDPSRLFVCLCVSRPCLCVCSWAPLWTPQPLWVRAFLGVSA